MADDHGWPGDAPGDAALGWGFTQVVRPPNRQPLGELCGNAQLPSPGCDRPNRIGACEPLVVHDVSDSGSGSGSDDEEVGFACVTQLYDRHEEAPPEEEEDGDDEGGDPAHWISEHDVGPCEPPEEPDDEDPGFEPVQLALEVLQLAHHVPALRAAGATWHSLQRADEAQLASWGLPVGARIRILVALAAARQGNPPWRVAGQPDVGVKRHRVAPPPPPPSGPERPIFEYFGGSKPPAPKPRAPPAAPRGGTKPPRRGAAPQPAVSGPMPPWHVVPGTRFTVDAFAPRVACRASPDTTAWFLTHFHSDHYSGLGARWSRGPVYCTAITAALCKLRLRVPASQLHVLPLYQRIVIDGVACTLFDANHCPGAAMILFEPPEPHPPVLHTGDCRWNTALHGPMLGPALAALPRHSRAGLQLILDTTYCDPAAGFPPSSEAVTFISNAVRSEGFNVARTLFLVGSYTIGKERCAFAAARAAGSRLYAGTAKREVLDCLAPSAPGVGSAGLAPADMALLTSDDRTTNVHIVPMACVSFLRMKGILAHYKGRFDTVVGFAPTGWAFGRAAAATGGSARRRQGALVRYDVPYSEHSSFQELRDCVAFLMPATICPSVNNDTGSRCAHMVELLTAPEGDPRLRPPAEVLRKPQWQGGKAAAKLKRKTPA